MLVGRRVCRYQHDHAGHRRELGLGRDAPLAAVPAKPPRLLLRFGLYAGIALIVAAAAGTWLAGNNARDRAERGVWQDARYTADQLARDDLAKVALRGPVTPGTSAPTSTSSSARFRAASSGSRSSDARESSPTRPTTR